MSRGEFGSPGADRFMRSLSLGVRMTALGGLEV